MDFFLLFLIILAIAILGYMYMGSKSGGSEYEGAAEMMPDENPGAWGAYEPAGEEMV